MIYRDQIKAARALLGISQDQLAMRSGVGVATIRRIETSDRLRGSAETNRRLQATLEAAGIEFIPEEEGKGVGVRLKRAKTGTGIGKL